ncbi:MAG TPA: hypothetical protein VHC18_09170 [Amycolatopsis sp.]|nr:hypothetical protein [Amycolatopsis sp.]
MDWTALKPIRTTVVTTPPCPFCGLGGQVRVPTRGLRAWEAGTPIQEAFALHDIGPVAREQLLTGVHGECWDKRMPPQQGDES